MDTFAQVGVYIGAMLMAASAAYLAVYYLDAYRRTSGVLNRAWPYAAMGAYCAGMFVLLVALIAKSVGGFA